MKRRNTAHGLKFWLKQRKLLTEWLWINVLQPSPRQWTLTSYDFDNNGDINVQKKRKHWLCTVVCAILDILNDQNQSFTESVSTRWWILLNFKAVPPIHFLDHSDTLYAMNELEQSWKCSPNIKVRLYFQVTILLALPSWFFQGTHGYCPIWSTRSGSGYKDSSSWLWLRIWDSQITAFSGPLLLFVVIRVHSSSLDLFLSLPEVPSVKLFTRSCFCPL